MAQPANTFDSYDMTGIIDDLVNQIFNIDPDDTPFLSKSPKTKAYNTYHEWQTDALRASADNAHIEGGDTSADARTATTRLGNYTQIFKNAVTISGTDMALRKAGRGKEMLYQMGKVMKEHKLDIERALFLNNARVAGSASVARELAGAPAWLITNVEFEAGNGGANPTGDGTDARTDDGTPVAFSQTRFDPAMQLIWESGGKPDTVYLSAFQMNLALGFTGNNAQRNTVKVGQIEKMIDVYRTPWGVVEFVLSRENRARDVFIFQDDMWKVAIARETKQEELAKMGDNERRQVVTELTLECCNEKAHGAVYDNTTS